MRKLTKNEIDTEATNLVFKLTCCIGIKNATKVLHTAWTKVRKQGKQLKKKYGEN